MSEPPNGIERRRRQRIPLAVPLMVVSLDPGLKFSAVCETIEVSSSGAQLRVSRSLPPGTRLRLDILNSDKITQARVVRSDSDGKGGWRVRVELLQQTGNFWGVKSPPADWMASLQDRDDLRWSG